MAKSRFMIMLDDGHGSTIDCKSNTTEGSIRETKDLIPDGIAFIVVQVKSDAMMYVEEKKRVLKKGENNGSKKESPEKDGSKESPKENKETSTQTDSTQNSIAASGLVYN